MPFPNDIERYVADTPDECPVCHHGIEPKYLAYTRDADAGGMRDLQIVFVCPRKECRAAFIAYYRERFARDSRQFVEFCLPWAPKTPDVPKLVAEVSPRFAEVYQQADAASSYRLDEVAGGGYRKALEVLIKDFLIAKGIKDDDTVIKMNLHDAIKAMPSEVVTNLAFFAKLLGNDETHYYRTWADKDIEDVKKYLAATMNALDLYLMHEEGREEFGTPK